MWIIPKTLQSPDPSQPLSFVQDTRAYVSDLNEQSEICASLLLVRSKPSPTRTWSRRWKKDSWTQHLSGRILKPSLTERFTTKWTSLLPDFPANPSQPPVSEEEMKTQDISSPTSNNPSLTCDPSESSLKTSKGSSLPGSSQMDGVTLEELLFCSMSLENWKGWVTSQRQEYSQRLKSVPPTNEKGCSSSGNWPTARVTTNSGIPNKATLNGTSKRDWRKDSRLEDYVVMAGPHAQESSSTTGSRRESLNQWPTLAVGGQTGGPTGMAGGSGNRKKLYALLGEEEGKKMGCGKLNPRWVETLMGLPIGWTMPSCIAPVTIELTNCDCSETESCQPVQKELGECCQDAWATPNTMDHLGLRTEEGVRKQATGASAGRTRPANLREQVDPETTRIYTEESMNLSTPQSPKTVHDRYLVSSWVDTALARGLEVHPDNLQFRTLPEKAEGTLSRPKNVKGRSFSWSYSALSAFEQCPKKYGENWFYKRLPYVETEATRWGKRVHTASEDFVNGKPVTDPEAFKACEKYARFFRALKEKGAEVIPELTIVLDEGMKPITHKNAYFCDEAWLRVAIDQPVIQGPKAGIYDFKTGKYNERFPPSDDQLKICACALSIVRPNIEVFTPKLIWTQTQSTTGIATGTIHKDEIPNIWAGILQRVRRMEQAWEAKVFQPRPSGLCKWKTGRCPLYDDCPEGQRR